MAVRNIAIFTICSNNYVPMAGVLVESVRQYCPNAAIYLCVADKIVSEPGFYPEDCEVVAVETLDIPEFKKFAFRYNVMEFNTAVKPFMFLNLLKKGHDAIIYFDPDIEIFAPLDGIIEKLDGGASFVVTPHLLKPAEGNSRPDDTDIMRAGIYNLGFLGVGATAETQYILEWWARRLLYQCVVQQEYGLFVDQKFIDLVPGFTDHFCILRDSNYNVAYWNLSQRSVTSQDGAWLVDARPLVFFHFSAFDPANLTQLSKHTGNFQGRAIPGPVLELMKHYADRVIKNGYSDARELDYGYGRFASGAVIPAETRSIFRAMFKNFEGDPFVKFESIIKELEPEEIPVKLPEELIVQINAIYASTSWKITAPLRAAKRLFKRLS